MTQKDILRRLQIMPQGLKDTYCEIFHRFDDDPEAKAIVHRVCTWVLCAIEPLPTEVLIGALRVHRDENTMSETVDEDLIRRLCNNLLVSESLAASESRNDSGAAQVYWKFSHLSVAEYFEQEYCSLPQAHRYTGKVCLTILCSLGPKIMAESDRVYDKGSLLEFFWEEDPQVSEARDEKSKVSPVSPYDVDHTTVEIYAHLFWKDHVSEFERTGESEPELTQLLETFLGPSDEPSVYYRYWVQVMTNPMVNWRKNTEKMCTELFDVRKRSVLPVLLPALRPFKELVGSCKD
jgi:hypothetical protein